MTTDPEIASLLECALCAAQAAGNHALANHNRRTETISRAAHDVKLALDLECQEIAQETVLERYPGSAITGEEGMAPADPETAGTAEWIIDPIDGTVNFSHGLPFWCCSVAVRRAGKLLAGAVYAPALAECYTAARGAHATCNGTPLAVSATPDLAGSLVCTGLDKNIDPRLPPFEIFRTLSASTQKTRVLGAAALDICRVASGQADGYFETGIYTWDVAAAGLIVEQAGGRIETLREYDAGRLMFLATNGLIHDALRELVLSV